MASLFQLNQAPGRTAGASKPTKILFTLAEVAEQKDQQHERN
jgi:hypothetical protein